MDGGPEDGDDDSDDDVRLSEEAIVEMINAAVEKVRDMKKEYKKILAERSAWIAEKTKLTTEVQQTKALLKSEDFMWKRAQKEIKKRHDIVKEENDARLKRIFDELTSLNASLAGGSRGEPSNPFWFMCAGRLLR